MRKLAIIIIFFLLNSKYLKAQFKITSPVKWSYAATKAKNGGAIVYLKATIGNGWHIYAQSGGTKTLQTSFVFYRGKDYLIIGKTLEPKPLVKFEKVLKTDVSYFEKSVVFHQKIKLRLTQVKVKGKLEFTVCNTKECRPAEEIEFSIPVI
ncbi:protein-disulfide reductase DsbD domain-containing protein [Pedobacter mendelii]|uniref:Thiol:disulfide interchange protein DsbD N-terminal domain-containing protein n=1 Tax=Pedobacter mendelii TaxID=1908240 RepID=A0ABQ2BMG8_9SPHI|nr:protein-disulfide reductase DsbD domain-containing protein [Pedobacter mendelii]GGI27939.1 hypothetical protein GCM10008119_30160 [Pedobacter mendelii]